MTHFSYTAERNDGEIYSGVAEAGDRFELYQVIRREGGRLLSMQADSSTNIFSWQYWDAKIGSVKEFDKILVARNLGAMIAAGLPLARALAVLERQTKSRKLSALIANIASEVRHGKT